MAVKGKAAGDWTILDSNIEYTDKQVSVCISDLTGLLLLWTLDTGETNL